MARTLDPGGDGDSGSSGGKHRGAKGHHAKRGRRKGHGTGKTRHPRARHQTPRTRHPRAWPRGGGGQPAGATPNVWHPPAHAGPGMAAQTLGAAPHAGAAALGAPGLTSTILELVGEGGITLGAALQAWDRERDRVANRAWRRPGGLARLGGL